MDFLKGVDARVRAPKHMGYHAHLAPATAEGKWLRRWTVVPGPG